MAFDNRDIKPRKRAIIRFQKLSGQTLGYIICDRRKPHPKEKGKTQKIVFSVFLVFFFVLVFVIAAVSINLSKSRMSMSLQAFPPNMTANCALFICPTTFLTAV